MVWPSLKIDSITIGIFFVGLIPWLTSIVESMKLPGGWEIKLRDLNEAGQKVIDNAPTTEAPESSTFLNIASQDPNLALVSLRIEIEKRARKIADVVDVPQRPLSQLLKLLEQRQILNSSALSGLQEIVWAGNQAAHGATVEPSLSEWAFTNGQNVLAALDAILEEKQSSINEQLVPKT